MIQIGRELQTVPPGLQSLVARAGGFNILGEPNFRVIWGWSRLTLIGGEWEDYSEDGSYLIRRVIEFREEPKYFLGLNRFHIEKWMPPEMYGPPQCWYDMTEEVGGGRSIDASGEFPSRGEYEHCWTIQNADQSFTPLDVHMCEVVIRAIEASRNMNRIDRRAAIDRREAQKEKDFELDSMNILHDARPALSGQPFVSVPVNLGGSNE